LVVIGGGPAGVIAATTAAAANKKTALIDCSHELGGAGKNTGTVPTKTLRETALALSGLRSRDLLGLDLAGYASNRRISDRDNAHRTDRHDESGDGGDICRGVFQCADTRDVLQDGHVASFG
jgi:pyruvate/2-oxoglutarate dehydrogenase complex dihydrolipoamide dehydrogenase (E3) component